MAAAPRATRPRRATQHPVGARRARALLALALLLALLGAPIGPVAAQGAGGDEGTVEVPDDPAGTPLPAQLVATVPPVGDVAPALDLTGFYVTPGVDADRPVVALRFAAPFDVPDEPWRASVSLGDPAGDRLRVSLRASGGSTTGLVELGPEGALTTLVSGEASFQPSGLVLLEVPLEDVPEGGIVWAEAAFDDGSGEPDELVRSPWYEQAAVLGTGAPGLVPSSPLGRFGAAAAVDGEGADGPAGGEQADGEQDGGAAAPVALGPGPTLGLAPRPGDPSDRSVVLVTWDAPAPTEVDGSAVVEVVDLVRVAPDDRGDAVTTPYVSVEPSSGAVTLVDGRVWPLEDRSGDRSWYLPGSSRFGEAGLEVLALDLDALLAALGEEGDRQSVGLGLTRTLRLADGRQVVADGVLATTAWLDQAVDLTVPTTAAPAPPPTSSTLATTSGDLTFVGWLALALVAVGWLAALVAVRQRRRDRRLAETAAAAVPSEPEDDRPWWERSRVRAAPGDGSGSSTPPASDVADPGADVVTAEDLASPGGAAAAGAAAAGAAAGASAADADVPVGAADAAEGAGAADADGVAGADGGGAAPAEPEPRHRPTGVTIAAARVTELVDEGSDPTPGEEAGAIGADGPPAGAAATAGAGADRSDRTEPEPEPEEAEGPDEALSTLSHDLSELTQRLRRLEGDGPEG